MGYNWNKVDRMSAEDAKRYLRRQYLKNEAKRKNARMEDRLAWSLMDSERFVSDPDGGCTYYGFIIGEDFADTYDVETTFEPSDAHQCPSERFWGAFLPLVGKCPRIKDAESSNDLRVCDAIV